MGTTSNLVSSGDFSFVMVDDDDMRCLLFVVIAANMNVEYIKIMSRKRPMSITAQVLCT